MTVQYNQGHKECAQIEIKDKRGTFFRQTVYKNLKDDIYAEA